MPRLSSLANAAALVALIVAGLASEIMADPLPPRTTVVAHGITARMLPQLTGSVIADARRPFRIDTLRGPITGHIKDRVIRSSFTRRLHFYTTVVVDRGRWSAKEADRIRLALVWKTEFLVKPGPLDVPLEVWYRTDAPCPKRPQTIDRDFRSISFWFSPTKGALKGDSVHFIHPGESSCPLLIATDALEFRLDGYTRLEVDHPFGGARHDIVETFVPVYGGKTRR